LLGEYFAVALVLLPALYFARWTLENRRLNARATMQVMTTASLFLFVFPETVFALRGGGWRQLFALDGTAASIWIQLLVLAALPSISAVQEFATRGFGTPIPYDPPGRLVTSGVYRYVANPMQVGCALSMGVWGVMLRNPWIALAMLGTLIYSIAVAGWDERVDLDERFGDSWRRFRREVRDWIPRWRPYFDTQAPRPRIYIAETCGICSELRRWLQLRNPLGLDFVAAENHPTRSLTRVTYDPMDGGKDEHGTRAFARALEHINLAWALVGALMRLPLLSSIIQMLADAAGLGPKNLDYSQCSPTADRPSGSSAH
jgi:protein-S-isoprenylcysteine O-methyltransferase Ste14